MLFESPGTALGWTLLVIPLSCVFALIGIPLICIARPRTLLEFACAGGATTIVAAFLWDWLADGQSGISPFDAGRAMLTLMTGMVVGSVIWRMRGPDRSGGLE